MPKDNIFIIGFNNKSQKTLIKQINDTFNKNKIVYLNGDEDLNKLQNTYGIIRTLQLYSLKTCHVKAEVFYFY